MPNKILVWFQFSNNEYQLETQRPKSRLIESCVKPVAKRRFLNPSYPLSLHLFGEEMDEQKAAAAAEKIMAEAVKAKCPSVEASISK